MAGKPKLAPAKAGEVTLPKSLVELLATDDEIAAANRTRLAVQLIQQGPAVAEVEGHYRAECDRVYRPFADMIAAMRGTFPGSKKGTHDWTGRTPAYTDAIAAVYEAAWPDKETRDRCTSNVRNYTAEAVAKVAPEKELRLLGQLPSQKKKKEKEKEAKVAARGVRRDAVKKSLDTKSDKLANAVITLEEQQQQDERFTIQQQLEVARTVLHGIMPLMVADRVELEETTDIEEALKECDAAMLDVSDAFAKVVEAMEAAEAEKSSADADEKVAASK